MSNEPTQMPGHGRLGTFVLAGMFACGLFPYAVSPILMYPDEPQYLDAGVFMCQSQDWLMPACPNDRPPEDLKPIFTYWVVALSYSLFGVSLAAARIPYLLAGLGTIWLTYRLTLMLTSTPKMRTGSQPVAALAVALLLSNPLIWLSAIRCLPDIWLCLFLLISAHGFIALLTLETATTKHALMAYLGVGLAFLAKGTPALVFLAFVFAFARFCPWRTYSWRRLIHVPGMALGLLVACSWLIIVFFTHGWEYLYLLWSDQVGTRAQRNPLVIAMRLVCALLAIALVLAPLYWPIWRAGRDWRSVVPPPGKERTAFAFIGLWSLLNVLAMCSATDWYLRYLLPAVPLIAPLIAMSLIKIDVTHLAYCVRRLLAATTLAVAAVVLLTWILGVQLGLRPLDLAICVALTAGLVLTAILGFRGDWLHAAQAIPAALLLMFVVTFFSIRNIAQPEVEAQIGHSLREENRFQGYRVAGFIGSKGEASRLRLALADRVKLMQWENPIVAQPELVAGTIPPLLVLPEKDATLLPANQYTFHPAASMFGSPDEEGFVRAAWAGRLGDCLNAHRRGYVIAIRIDDRAQTASRQ